MCIEYLRWKIHRVRTVVVAQLAEDAGSHPVPGKIYWTSPYSLVYKRKIRDSSGISVTRFGQILVTFEGLICIMAQNAEPILAFSKIFGKFSFAANIDQIN